MKTEEEIRDLRKELIEERKILVAGFNPTMTEAASKYQSLLMAEIEGRIISLNWMLGLEERNFD